MSKSKIPKRRKTPRASLLDQIRHLEDGILKLQRRIESAEMHNGLFRRLINDVCREELHTVFVSREKEGSPAETVPVVDWAWYGSQQYHSISKQQFEMGIVLTPEEIKERAQKIQEQMRHNAVMHVANIAAENSEKGLKDALEGNILKEYLKAFKPPGLRWDAAMDELAPDMVLSVLQQREYARTQQREQEKIRQLYTK